MSRHVCEVWAEQGWCPHTRPDLGERLRTAVENFTEGLRGIRLTAHRLALPGDDHTLRFDADGFHIDRLEDGPSRITYHNTRRVKP